MFLVLFHLEKENLGEHSNTIDLGLIIWQFFPGQWSKKRPDFSAFFFLVGTSNQSDPGMAIDLVFPFSAGRADVETLPCHSLGCEKPERSRGQVA